MINFLVSGIVIIVKYKTIRDCFFKVCRSDSRFFERNYFEDVWVKMMFALNIILLIIFKYLYLNNIKRFDLRRNNERITPGSYTAYVGNIDGIEEGSKLDKFFEQMVSGVKVKKINFVYNISEIYEIVRQWMNIEKHLTVLQTKGLSNSVYYNNLITKRRKLKEEYYALKNEIKIPENFNKRFTGFAFVTFEMQKHLNAVLSKLRYKIISFQYHKTKYTIYPANEPEDIIWQNFGLNLKQKIVRRFLSAVVTTMIILISFGIVFGIKYAQDTVNKQSKSKAFYYFVAFAIAEIILIVNLILRIVLRKLTFWQSRTTTTAYNSVLTLKITIVYFCNIALVILVANIIVLKTDLWGTNGVVGNIFIFQAIAVVSNCIYEMLNPIYLMKKVYRWYYAWKIRKSFRANKVLQVELNKAYEGINFDIAERYYLTFKTISVLFFFQTVMPYLLLFGIAELTLIYWTQKYILYKRAKRPKDIDFNFSLKMTRIFDLMIFVLALGYFIFEIIISRKTSVFAILICGLTIASGIIGEGFSRLKFFDEKHEGTEEPFSTACKTFPNDYDRLNPVTQKEAVMEWLATIGTMPGSYRSLQHINEPAEEELDSKIFNTISRYVTRDNRYGCVQVKLNKAKSSEIVDEGNVDDSLMEVKDVNFYEVASKALDRQRSLYFKHKFLDQKTSKQIAKCDQKQLEPMSSRIILSEFLPQQNVNVNPFCLELTTQKKKFPLSLEEIKEERDEIAAPDEFHVEAKRFGFGGSLKVINIKSGSDLSNEDTMRDYEIKVRTDFEKLAEMKGNDHNDTYNDED